MQVLHQVLWLNPIAWLHLFLFYFFMSTTDTSILENLRKQALRKKPSHRNWREWHAIVEAFEDNEVILSQEISYLKRANIGYIFIGISIGLVLALIILKFYEI